MKKTALFIFLFLLTGCWIATGDARENPIAVSPGSETGLAKVSQTCPTFSWSAVEQASSYWIAVFQSPDAVVRAYADIAVTASPVIVKEIAGPALSWTLPAEERLQSGALYAWYVQAVDSAGNRLGSCSTARVFKVEQEAAWAGMDGKMEVVLRSHGVREEVIAGAMKDWKSSMTDFSVRSTPAQKPTKLNGNGTEGPTNTFYLHADSPKGYEGPTNTFYGTGAGTSISSGAYDTFIGANAGYNNTSGGANTIVGYAAGFNNTSGVANTFMGDAAGNSNTTGDDNTFIGRWAGWENTTGFQNTFIGSNAGIENTTGSYNTFLGGGAGYSNTTGSDNTFLGLNAGYSNTTGTYNTFLGNSAGQNNATGSENTFLGNSAGQNNTTGSDNTFIGRVTGLNNNTGSYNTFLGNYAGQNNTEGYINTFIGVAAGGYNTTGTYNTFLGNSAGQNNTEGHRNTFIGVAAGGYNTTGTYNTFLGSYAGTNNTTGCGNTFLGYEAGNFNTTGCGNIFLGHLAGFNETGFHKLYIDNSETNAPLIYGEFDNDIVTINGRLGIGTKTPGYPLEIVTTGAKASIVVGRPDGAKNWMNATTAFGNFGTVNNYPLRLQVNSVARMTLYNDNSLMMANTARLTAGGVWTDASSIALKENISALNTEEAATTLQALNPVKYNYKADKNENHVGFIAEEVPDLVAMKDRKSLSPMDIVAVLTKVTQDQQKTIENLTRKMQEYQQNNDKMKMEMAELKEKLLN